ncbi:MAG: replicative DNA helicase [Clostridia bacterium]|nr:replicative DNA helicase [Clostridia bacterium]
MTQYRKKSPTKEIRESARAIPNDVKMEQSVLACIINGSEDIKIKLVTQLNVEDFYLESHKIIYDCIKNMYNTNLSIDFLTLYDSLCVNQVINEIGGIEYMNEIRSCIPSYTNYENYLQIVKRDSVLRKIINMCRDISDHAMISQDKDECLSYAEKAIFDLAQKEEKSDFVHIKDATSNVYKDIMETFQNKGKLRGLMTGFYGLDKLTNGFQESDLVLLAARPSVGKTSFAMNIVDNASKLGKKVAVFSLEMSAEQLAKRMLCSDSAVNMSKVSTGDLNDKEIMRIMSATQRTNEKNIYIYDNSNVTAADVRAKCQELKKKIGLDFIMIDYLQLMSSGSKGGGGSDINRQQEVAEITRNLKITCRELKVPILLLSQLSRAVEQRQGHKPQLSDLRESGAIEQDADIVMFLHNPSRYDDTQKQMDDEARKRAQMGLFDVELIVAKHRNGALATINLQFRSENTTFLSVDKDRNNESLHETAPMEKREIVDQKFMATEEEKKQFRPTEE